MKRYSTEEKRMWVEDWRGSGKSAWAYAKANGLFPRTFVQWTKDGGGSEGPAFVEVPVPALPPVRCHGTPEILIEKGDVKIHIPLSVNRGELRAVMEGLGAVL